MPYQLSPFLFKQSDGLYLNQITNQLLRFPSFVHERLQRLVPGFAPEDVSRSLAIDGTTAAEFCTTLANKHVLLDAEIDAFRLYTIRIAGIEISSHCNARCCFCPVSLHPLPKKIMPLGDFERIVQKLAVEPHLQWVELNHYNEPLLDQTFLKKVEILASHRIKLRLHTNGHFLTQDLSKRLAELKIVESIVFNIPSADPTQYRELMGVKMPPHLLDALYGAVDAGLLVYLSVNGSPMRASQNCSALKTLMERHGVGTFHTFVNFTNDRAGLLSNPEAPSYGRWTGKLGGCRRIFDRINISVDGNVFLCCQDYHQQHIFGNIFSHSVKEIMGGDQAAQIRRKVFGADPSSADFICRSCVESVRIQDVPSNSGTPEVQSKAHGSRSGRSVQLPQHHFSLH